MPKKAERPTPESYALPKVGVETHAHLDIPEMQEDLAEVLDNARKAGVAAFGNVFLTYEYYQTRRSLFDNHPDVFYILGSHPHSAEKLTDANLADMAQAYREDQRIKAVGEIGLDYLYLHLADKKSQDKSFKAQLELARSLDLPVVIHSRDAFPETLAVLKDMGFNDHPVLWHCFGAGPDEARQILSLGYTISLPGPVTYAKNTQLMEAAKIIPLEQMVIETDCPYLTPEPWRGHRNEPAYLAYTSHKIAELKDLPHQEVWQATGDTARRFFNLT